MFSILSCMLCAVWCENFAGWKMYWVIIFRVSSALCGLRGGNAFWFICWFWRYINCSFVYFTSLLSFFLILFPYLSSLDGLNRKHCAVVSGWSISELNCYALQQWLKTDADVSSSNIGLCGLHQVHGAFKSGADLAGWDVEKFSSNLYWFFKDTPARGEHYVATTESSVFLQKTFQ